DVLTRDGSTYFAKPRPDFLSANDAWFIPVSQKTGPDGCLYILDWYDRYHCYQDANRDPAGIDRLRGRLYRVRYKNTPRAPKFDLTKETDEQLIARLHSPNVFFRDMAQRILCERNNAETRTKLAKRVLDAKSPHKGRMHALWTLIGMGPLDAAFHERLLSNEDASYRAWGVRAAGNQAKVTAAIQSKVLALARDASPDVQLQVAIAARKIQGEDAISTLLDVLSACGEDKLIPVIVWQNLHPLLEDRAEQFLQIAAKREASTPPALARMMPRVVERILGRRKTEPRLLVTLFRLLTEGKTADARAAGQCLGVLANKVQTGEINGEQAKTLHQRFAPHLRKLLADNSSSPLRMEAALLAASLNDPRGRDIVRRCCRDKRQPEGLRLRALEALIATGDDSVLDSAAGLLAGRKANSLPFRAHVLAALGKLDDKQVSATVLDAYERMEPDLQPKAIELLTQRAAWGKQLLQAIADKKIPSAALNVNQVRKLLASKDAELIKQVKTIWG
ncbi:MAG: DUF7133 domain-containing protein, partial [Gemmataceae bacterium]